MTAQSETSPQRRYRLIAEIGRGGMAEVYLAVAQGPGGFNKLVVIKKALQALALQPDFLSMFLDEARLAARMNHPNVVQTYEYGEEDGRQFIAMEYLDGQPYSRILARLRGRTGLESMPLAHHIRILIDTLSGLHHAHELKDFDGTPLHVVHRDVTPQNVFVTYDGSTKVVDFGIAKTHDSSSRTLTGELKGKVTYMSPEQVRGEPLDRRSDLFAIGIMLWEAVAGRRMWREIPDIAVVSELLYGRVPSIRELCPHAPPELVHIIERALSPDREQRYPSALAMQRDLDEFAIVSGARVDGAEVGRAVSEWFEEERRRVRAVVEAQLGSLRWTGENPSAAGLPVIPLPPQSITGRSDWGHDPRQATPSVLPTNGGAALSMPTSTARHRSPLLLVLGVLVAAVVGAGVVLVLARPLSRTQSSAPAALAPDQPTATASAGQPAATASGSVSIKVRATPASAKIFLDGVLLGEGSFEGKVPKSDGQKVLRVEAEGYQAKEEKLPLSSDLITSFALEKLEAEASASAAPVVRPSGPRPQPGGRGIDPDSPYR